MDTEIARSASQETKGLETMSSPKGVKPPIERTEIPVVVIEGDGIGPAIVAATIKVVNHAISSTHGSRCNISWEPVLAGRKALEETGSTLPEETLLKLRNSGLGLKGPLETQVAGGFRSINVALRKTLDLFANIRPVRPFEGLENPAKTADNLRVVIFRENTEDVYAGIEYEAGSLKAMQLIDDFGLENEGVSRDSALAIKPISELATRRLVRKATEHAITNGLERITLVHKGNIMKFTEGAFRDWGYDEAKKILGDRFLPWEEFNLAGREIPTGKILVQDRIADAMFQDLVLCPQNHQVLATMNLNGDYLSDAAAALVGGLGLSPGINQGDKIALAEAVHGTAPDIAGQDKANPTALLLSAVMLLRSIDLNLPADLIERAIEENFKRGELTGDLARRHSNPKILGTKAFTDSLCKRIDELS